MFAAFECTNVSDRVGEGCNAALTGSVYMSVYVIVCAYVCVCVWCGGASEYGRVY